MRQPNQNDAPKVIIITAIPSTINAFLLPQMAGMKDTGMEVVACCSNGEGISSLKNKFPTITIEIPRNIAPIKLLKAYFNLWKQFRDRRPDIVHTHTPIAAFVGQLAARWARVDVRVNTVHGYYFEAYASGWKRWLFKNIELISCRLATHVFYVSPEDHTNTLANNWVKNERTSFLVNGIDLDKFNPNRFTKLDNNLTRQSFDIPDNSVVVGIVARMVKEKGLKELFEAIAKIIEQSPNVYLLHVGFIDRSRNDAITPQSAEQLGISKNCRFLGLRFDIPELLSAMDIFCLPSYREGFPVSVIEAAAMQLPCVVTDVRGCREVIRHEIDGLIVPPRDSDSLANAISLLVNNKGLREKFGKNARDRAVMEFDEKRVVNQVVQTYTKLLKAAHKNSGKRLFTDQPI